MDEYSRSNINTIEGVRYHPLYLMGGSCMNFGYECEECGKPLSIDDGSTEMCGDCKAKEEED
jgi:hypothetical protein